MKVKLSGLVFGNDKKQCLREALKKVMEFTDSVELKKLRKLPGKDLYKYEFEIDVK